MMIQVPPDLTQEQESLQQAPPARVLRDVSEYPPPTSITGVRKGIRGLTLHLGNRLGKHPVH